MPNVSSAMKFPASPDFATEIERVSALSSDVLIGIAVARGCHHYAPFVAENLAVDRSDVPHEILGCALLRGGADLDTFQSVRVAAMILSDDGCDPALVARVADDFGVSSRLAHIAQLALETDDRQSYWRQILARLLRATSAGDAAFLPGVSRFTLETDKAGPGRGPVRIWLRTKYLP